MKENKEFIQELGTNVSLDSSKHFLCPWCSGGKSQEKSLVVTRQTATLLYLCHRASCGKHGIIAAKSSPKTAPKPRRAHYSGKMSLCQASLHNIPLEALTEQGIRMAVDINRLYMPIYDYRGYQNGELLRATSPLQKPKALINKFNDTALLHFPLNQDIQDKLVLVEDMFSAIKVAQVMPCASLLGTNLSKDGLMLLKKLGIKHLYLMLDGDNAGLTATANLYRKTFPHFEQVIRLILPPGKDPKDLDRLTLEEYFK